MKALFLAALLVACSAPAPAVATPAPTPESGVLSVVALLDLSGPHAVLGAAQRDALQMWTDLHTAPLTVKLHVVDIAGSDARTIIELHRAAVEDAASAVVVGTPLLYDETFGHAVELGGAPVLFTLPLSSDPAGLTGGRWSFALAPSVPRLASAEIDDARRRGTVGPSLVLTDARERVDAFATALESEEKERGLDPLPRIALPGGGGVPATLRSSLALLRSVHCTAVAAACGAVAQAAQSAGAPTFFYLSYLADPADLAAHSELAARSIWPGSRTIVPLSTPPLTEVDQARAVFLRTFADRHGQAGTHAATAYDVMSLLAAAAERSSPNDRAALRDALERITMPLIATTYAFGPSRHAGADPDDTAYLRWVGSRVSLALLPFRGPVIATLTPSPVPSPRPSAPAAGQGARP